MQEKRLGSGVIISTYPNNPPASPFLSNKLNKTHLILFSHSSLAMATCSSLRSLFDSPLPDKSTVMEALAWSQAKSIKPMEHAVTEMFGELHFHERPVTGDRNPIIQEKVTLKPVDHSVTEMFGELHFQERQRQKSVLPESNVTAEKENENPSLEYLLSGRRSSSISSFDSRSGGGFSPKNCESLKKCTEGLGSESSDDIDNLRSEIDYEWKCDDHVKEAKDDGGSRCLNPSNYSDRRARIGGGRGFPPPISMIGRSGKPWMGFQSFREGGRFVLREIRIPTHEILSASRHDGRLKLHFVHPESDMPEEEGEWGEESDEGEQVCGGESDSVVNIQE